VKRGAGGFWFYKLTVNCKTWKNKRDNFGEFKPGGLLWVPLPNTISREGDRLLFQKAEGGTGSRKI
jgi:hypothetical protein